jgi:hypothetical protein
MRDYAGGVSDDEVVFDLTGVEDSDWLKRSRLALEDLAISLPPGTDLREYLEGHPEMPLAKAVLSGELEIPDDLPASAIGDRQRFHQELIERLSRGMQQDA